ncbi:MAG: 50S ribosomal protein L30 [Candidatus Micrarchaeota archaeon]|nr:50S ribosomal protein L30 [Candidatus Micrarchaeota archaeon]
MAGEKAKENAKKEKAVDGKGGNRGRLLAVVRVRGTRGLRRTISRTLELFGMTRKHSCVLVRQNASVDGMLVKAKDYATWGEASEATVAALLGKKASLAGGKRLDDGYVSAHTGFKSVGELARALGEGMTDLGVVPGLSKVFRLQPPKGGFDDTKRLYPAGACGYRGEKINELVMRML